MSESSQLVFYGEILPGHEAHTVKAKLGDLLKLPVEQIGAVFSGQRVVLRKNLPSEQVASYVARLEKIGVKVFAESLPLAAAITPLSARTPVPAVAQAIADAKLQEDPVVDVPPVAPFVPETQVPAPEAAAAIEEMDCPKCGERQPRRTLCRACSVDMKRFAESQQQAEQEAHEERMMAREVALIERGRGQRVSVGSDEEVGLFGFGLSGRIGRVNYWIGGFPILAIAALSLWLAMKSGIWAVGILGLLAVLFMSLRLTALRCHDINWSGWFSLIMCVPYVSVVFVLILGFMPGTKGDNNHGSPGRTVGIPAALGMLAACGVCVALALSQAETAVQTYFMASNGQGASKAKNQGVLTVAEADVEMFTTSDCGVCHMAKAYMNKRGITYAEKDVEKNEDYLREFYARGGRGVPYIFVGNQSMEGFDAGRLEQMLSDSRT